MLNRREALKVILTAPLLPMIPAACLPCSACECDAMPEELTVTIYGPSIFEVTACDFIRSGSAVMMGADGLVYPCHCIGVRRMH